jgi:hypothetical protein
MCVPPKFLDEAHRDSADRRMDDLLPKEIEKNNEIVSGYA